MVEENKRKENILSDAKTCKWVCKFLFTTARPPGQAPRGRKNYRKGKFFQGNSRQQSLKFTPFGLRLFNYRKGSKFKI
jgi:hypothetical protein